MRNVFKNVCEVTISSGFGANGQQKKINRMAMLSGAQKRVSCFDKGFKLRDI